MARMISVTVLSAALVACGAGKPVGPPQRIQAFAAEDTPITRSGVTAEEGGWRIVPATAGSVPLFEVPLQGVEYTTLTYRARMKASDVKGRAYLEMWVRVPGRGEFFSRGLAQPLQGSSGWASYEIPFFLNERGVRPDLAKLNVAFEGGTGTVWVKDVELLQTPLSG
jgi:hypothetical protein